MGWCGGGCDEFFFLFFFSLLFLSRDFFFLELCFFFFSDLDLLTYLGGPSYNAAYPAILMDFSGGFFFNVQIFVFFLLLFVYSSVLTNYREFRIYF